MNDGTLIVCRFGPAIESKTRISNEYAYSTVWLNEGQEWNRRPRTMMLRL